MVHFLNLELSTEPAARTLSADVGRKALEAFLRACIHAHIHAQILCVCMLVGVRDVYGSGFVMLDSRFQVQDLGFRVQGSGLRFRHLS